MAAKSKENSIFARFLSTMGKRVLFVLACCLCMMGCNLRKDNNCLLHRDFFNNSWERFDYVYNDIEIQEGCSYDLTAKLSFTDDYPFDYISMVFNVFDEEGTPYRSKGYKFKLKDAEGQWNSELKDGCYTFELPINKELQLTEKGKYRFQIENRMPITPLMGVKELSLVNNKN